MSRTLRLVRIVVLASIAAALIAAPVSAAEPLPRPDKPGPSFAVTLNRSDVVDIGIEYLALTFTSTSAARARGRARLELPTRLIPHTTFKGGFWRGDALQTTDPSADGYFRIESTSCRDAELTGFSNGVFDSNVGYVKNPKITVEFNCAPGQAFVIHWFLESVNHEIDSCCKYDTWSLGVASRSFGSRRWTPQAPPTLRVHWHFITLPPLSFITPPLQLVDMEPIITDPAEPPTTWLLTGDAIVLNQRVSSEVTAHRIFRADTGEELVLVDPYDFRIDQTDIQVTSCIDLGGDLTGKLPPGIPPYDFDCSAMPEVVIFMPNPGSVKNADGSFLSSQIAVIFSVIDIFTGPRQWKAAESRCLFRGGVYLEHTNSEMIWRCTLPAPAQNNDRYFFVSNELRQAEFCPTGKLRDEPALVTQQVILCTL